MKVGGVKVNLTKKPLVEYIQKNDLAVSTKYLYTEENCGKSIDKIFIRLETPELFTVLRKDADFKGDTSSFIYYAAAFRNHIVNHGKIPSKKKIKSLKHWAIKEPKLLEKKAKDSRGSGIEKKIDVETGLEVSLSNINIPSTGLKGDDNCDNGDEAKLKKLIELTTSNEENCDVAAFVNKAGSIIEGVLLSSHFYQTPHENKKMKNCIESILNGDFIARYATTKTFTKKDGTKIKLTGQKFFNQERLIKKYPEFKDPIKFIKLLIAFENKMTRLRKRASSIDIEKLKKFFGVEESPGKENYSVNLTRIYEKTINEVLQAKRQSSLSETKKEADIKKGVLYDIIAGIDDNQSFKINLVTLLSQFAKYPFRRKDIVFYKAYKQDKVSDILRGHLNLRVYFPGEKAVLYVRQQRIFADKSPESFARFIILLNYLVKYEYEKNKAITTEKIKKFELFARDLIYEEESTGIIPHSEDMVKLYKQIAIDKIESVPNIPKHELDNPKHELDNKVKLTIFDRVLKHFLKFTHRLPFIAGSKTA